MLNSISLFYYFEIALVIREARLINGTLTNSEVWPSLSLNQFEYLESADLDLMRSYLNWSRTNSIQVCHQQEATNLLVAYSKREGDFRSWRVTFGTFIFYF